MQVLVVAEQLLVRSGLKLIKYWLSVSDDEQEKRFQQRASDPTKLWKLSPMVLMSVASYRSGAKRPSSC